MILTKQIRLDLTTTTFFVQINDYGKWEASLQISIKPQQIVLTFASRNGKFNEGVNKFCTIRSRLPSVYHVVGLFWVNWVNSIKPFQQKAWFSILYWFSIYEHLTFIHLLLTYSLLAISQYKTSITGHFIFIIIIVVVVVVIVIFLFFLRTGMTWKIILTRRRMINLKIKISYYRKSELTKLKYRDKG